MAVLADDLIWSSRLSAAATNAGARPIVVKDAASIDAPFAVIDLGGRAYDGVEAVRIAASAGATVLAVAQHEDVELRKAALAAGAKRSSRTTSCSATARHVIARLIEGTL